VVDHVVQDRRDSDGEEVGQLQEHESPENIREQDLQGDGKRAGRAILQELNNDRSPAADPPVAPRPCPVPQKVVHRGDEDARHEGQVRPDIRGLDSTIHKLVGDVEHADVDNRARKPDGSEFCEALPDQPLPSGQP